MKKLIIDLVLITLLFMVIKFCLKYLFGLDLDKQLREFLAIFWGAFMLFKISNHFIER